MARLMTCQRKAYVNILEVKYKMGCVVGLCDPD